jgi:hypothetical protein
MKFLRDKPLQPDMPQNLGMISVSKEYATDIPALFYIAGNFD